MIEVTMISGKPHQLPFNTIQDFWKVANRPWYQVNETGAINMLYVESVKVVTGDGLQTKGKRKERA